MVYTEYNYTGQGLGGLFVFAKQTVPFYDAILFTVILLVLTFSMYFIQESRRGRGDFPVAFAVGSTTTTVLMVIISMLAGFISGGTLGVFIALTILSYIILFWSTP